MPEIEVPSTPEITGPIAEWIELLENAKTCSTALACIIYIGNAFKSAASPVRVKISISTCDVSSYDRAISVKDGVINLIGSPSRQVEIIPSNDPRIPRKDWVDSKKCALYADHLKEVINRFGRPKKNDEGANISEAVIGFFYGLFNSKKEKQPWSDVKRSDGFNKVLQKLENFFTYGSNGEFTRKIGQLLLNAIVSIDRGTHKNIYSPLFEATNYQDLDAVIMLLSYGVDVNVRDTDKLTALHYAIDLNYELIAKTLILFGADRLQLKIRGKSVRYICIEEGKIRTLRKRHTSTIGRAMIRILKVATLPASKIAEPKKKHKRMMLRATKIDGKKTHLLSLDGGGIRGLVLTTRKQTMFPILSEIEREIPRFFDKFQFVAGTSTGSILALALCQGRTVAECRNMYFKFKDFVFSHRRGIHYDHTILENFLKKTYRKSDGNDMTMHELGQISGKKIISTSVDQAGAKLDAVHFKSYEAMRLDKKDYQPFPELKVNPRRIEVEEDDEREEANSDSESCASSDDTLAEVPEIVESDEEEPPNSPKQTAIFDARINKLLKDTRYLERDPERVTVNEVARCTSAAPFYFKSPQGTSYVDGGVLNNNPSMVLLNEWIKCNEVEKTKDEEEKGSGEIMKLGAMVSIGTGKLLDDYSEGQCLPREGRCCYELRSAARIVLQLKGQIARSDGPVVRDSRSLTHSHSGSFYRFSPFFAEEIELDETDNQTLIEMMWETKKYMRMNTEYLNILKKVFASDGNAKVGKKK